MQSTQMLAVSQMPLHLKMPVMMTLPAATRTAVAIQNIWTPPRVAVMS